MSLPDGGARRERMCSAPPRTPSPSEVSDEEWSLVVSYLTLMTEAALQHEHSLREMFNALRYVIRYGIVWRAMPNDFPPWAEQLEAPRAEHVE